MALISAKTIITFLCLFHVTIGFFFINSPRTIADQAVVWVLGEAMGMVRFGVLSSRQQRSSCICQANSRLFSPRTVISDRDLRRRHFSASSWPSWAYATSSLLACRKSSRWSITGEYKVRLPLRSSHGRECDSVANRQLRSTAPLRLTISFFLVAYTFLASSSSPVYSDASREHIGSHPSARQPNPSYIPSSWGGDGLKNRVFFAFMFVELIGWFWTWVTLREEREAFMLRKAKRRNSHSI